MGEKKRRNLGGPLLSNLNWLLAALLFLFGIVILILAYLVKRTLPDAPQTAATLIGALWGSAALLLGAQINEVIRHREEARKNLQKVENLSNILLNQFNNVCISLSLFLNSIKIYLYSLNTKQIVSFNLNNLNHPVHFNYELNTQNNFLSNDFMYKNLLLLENNVGKIIKFHQNVEKFRLYSIFWSKKSESKISREIAFFLLEYLCGVFDASIVLAESMWPDEQIEIEGKTENLVQFLQKNLKTIKELRQPGG